MSPVYLPWPTVLVFSHVRALRVAKMSQTSPMQDLAEVHSGSLGQQEAVDGFDN